MFIMHTCCAVAIFLNRKKMNNDNWPPRSCDITPLDYFEGKKLYRISAKMLSKILKKE